MSSNVHALERIRTLRTVVDRPDRADVEAAFRTIIRWTGDDPERDGLIEIPARVARAFRSRIGPTIDFTMHLAQPIQKSRRSRIGISRKLDDRRTWVASPLA